jgi:hypothetical protein
MFDEEEAWDVVAEIPKDTAGLLVLLENRWAIPCGTPSPAPGGFRLASEFISPLDLVAVGLFDIGVWAASATRRNQIPGRRPSVA